VKLARAKLDRNPSGWILLHYFLRLDYCAEFSYFFFYFIAIPDRLWSICTFALGNFDYLFCEFVNSFSADSHGGHNGHAQGLFQLFCVDGYALFLPSPTGLSKLRAEPPFPLAES
jgi:hypothetical protein